jgi:hypothetical protein
LHTGPANGFDVPAPTLWLAKAGSSVAQQVTTTGIGMFAWSPTDSVLAFTTTNENNSTVPVPENLWIDEPGSPPTNLAVGMGNGVDAISWSPNGAELAFDDTVIAQPATTISPATPPISRIGVVSPDGGQPEVIYQLSETGLDLAGWWPEGDGVLFWEDPGFAETNDGATFYSLATGSQQPTALTTSLVGPTWWEPGPGDTVAVVAGSGRTIWNAGRDVDLCALTISTCQDVAIPPGSVGLAPRWTSSGALLLSVASATGAFGPTGDAFYSPGYMAEWNATNVLWRVSPGGQPSPVTPAPPGTLLAAPASLGNTMVVVAGDALWLVDSTARPPVQIAAPLYSTIGPSGYYGEVDWAGTFAWSFANGPRQGSTDLLGEILAQPESELP